MRHPCFAVKGTCEDLKTLKGSFEKEEEECGPGATRLNISSNLMISSVIGISMNLGPLRVMITEEEVFCAYRTHTVEDLQDKHVLTCLSD